MYSTFITTCGTGTFILIIILTETNIVKRLGKRKGMGDGLVGRLEIGLYAKENLTIMSFVTNIRNKNS